MHAEAVVAVVAAVLLAGCAGGAPEGSPDDLGLGNGTTETDPPTSGSTQPTPTEAMEPDRLDWEIRDCFFFYGTAQADAAQVSTALPEGFSLPGGAAGRVGVAFEANDCERGTGLNGTVEPMFYASVWVGVTPPGDLQDPSVFHVINFDVLVPDEPRRTWLTDRGAPAYPGAVVRSARPDGGVSVVATYEGLGDFVFEVLPGSQGAAGSGTFDQWTPGTGPLTYWRTDWASQGPQTSASGTVEFPPASRYASWFEAGVVAAQFVHGTWDYTDGFIEHPAPGT